MKILILKLGRIGDMVLFTPTLKILNENFSDSKIDIICSKANYPILLNNNRINNIIVYDKSLKSIFKVLKTLLFGKYDYYLDPKDHPSSESRFFSFFSNTKNKIGYNFNNKKVFNIEIEPKKKIIHYSENMAKILSGFNIKNYKLGLPELFLNDNSEIYVKEFIKSNHENYILLNISASHKGKTWQNQKWLDFLNYNKEYKFILCYGPNDKDDAKYLLENSDNLIEFQSRNINDAISITKYCRLLITVDTAMVHISSAYDKPIIALFNGIDIDYDAFYPLNSNKIVLRNPIGERGLSNIKVEELNNAYLAMLQKITFD